MALRRLRPAVRVDKQAVLQWRRKPAYWAALKSARDDQDWLASLQAARDAARRTYAAQSWKYRRAVTIEEHLAPVDHYGDRDGTTRIDAEKVPGGAIFTFRFPPPDGN